LTFEVSRIDAVALADCSIVLVRLQRSYGRLLRPRTWHHEHWQNVVVTRLPLLTSLANLHLSCKYVGASPRESGTLTPYTASLKSIRRLTGITMHAVEQSQESGLV